MTSGQENNELHLQAVLEQLPQGDLPERDDYAEMFIHDVPLLDVRAPVEFAQGAFPGAINVPLLTDEEREAVGIRYKEQGQNAAIQLGAELLSETQRKERQQRWADFFRDHPDGALYCFRGGLRSKISQQWTLDACDSSYPRITGGYKAMRRFLIESIERIIAGTPILLVGGRTGSGKTRFINQLANSLDLEGLANHRGSAFGPTATPQPTPINFENALAVALLKFEAAGHDFLILEDEGRHIGSLGIPQSLFERMCESPIVRLEVNQSERVAVSIQEYILDIHAQFQSLVGNSRANQALADHLLTSLDKVKKRLGGLRHRQIREQMQAALDEYFSSGALAQFEPLIKTLLIDYYDPMYDYQAEIKADRVVFSGSRGEVENFIGSYTAKL